MIRRLWVFLCQCVGACTIGMLAGYVVTHGFSDGDWELYVVTLAVTMTALWQVVLFRD